MLRTISAAIAVSAGLAACAPVEDAPTTAAAADDDRQCFFSSQVDGFSDAPDGPEGEDRIHISTGPNDVWLFDTWGPCPELDFTLQIGFDPGFQGSICQGDTVDLLVPRFGRTDRCPVRMVRKLTPEEEAAS